MTGDVKMSSTSALRVLPSDHHEGQDRAHHVADRAHPARAAIAHARDAATGIAAIEMKRKQKMNRLWIHSEPLLMIGKNDHVDQVQVQVHHPIRLLTRQNARVVVIVKEVRKIYAAKSIDERVRQRKTKRCPMMWLMIFMRTLPSRKLKRTRQIEEK